jgi:hypothetical protein
LSRRRFSAGRGRASDRNLVGKPSRNNGLCFRACRRWLSETVAAEASDSASRTKSKAGLSRSDQNREARSRNPRPLGADSRRPAKTRSLKRSQKRGLSSRRSVGRQFDNGRLVTRSPADNRHVARRKSSHEERNERPKRDVNSGFSRRVRSFFGLVRRLLRGIPRPTENFSHPLFGVRLARRRWPRPKGHAHCRGRRLGRYRRVHPSVACRRCIRRLPQRKAELQ